MNEKQLKELLNNLVKQPHENEWVEFKLNFHSPEEIGEQISALSNGAVKTMLQRANQENMQAICHFGHKSYVMVM